MTTSLSERRETGYLFVRGEDGQTHIWVQVWRTDTNNPDVDVTVRYGLPYVEHNGYQPEPWETSHGQYEWGYAGSGPHDTAISLLAHALGETWPCDGVRRTAEVEESFAAKYHRRLVDEYLCGLSRAAGVADELSQEHLFRMLRSWGCRWAGRPGWRWVGRVSFYDPDIDNDREVFTAEWRGRQVSILARYGLLSRDDAGFHNGWTLTVMGEVTELFTATHDGDLLDAVNDAVLRAMGTDWSESDA